MTFLDQAAEQLPDEFHDGWLSEHAADADEFYRELAQWHDAHGEEAYQAWATDFTYARTELCAGYSIFRSAAWDVNGVDWERIAPDEAEVERVRAAINANVERHPSAPFALGTGYEAGRLAPIHEDRRVEDQRMGIPYGPEYGFNTNIEDGLVRDAEGEPLDGDWGWVVPANGEGLTLFDRYATIAINPETGERVNIRQESVEAYEQAGWQVEGSLANHSSPVSGGDVVGAGELTLDEGRIVEISNRSGHYLPDATQQLRAMGRIEELGAKFLDNARVELMDDQDWLNAAKETNAYFPQGEVGLRVDQFKQTGGDEFQIRAKMGVNAQIADLVSQGELAQAPATAQAWGTREPTPEETPDSDSDGERTADSEGTADQVFLTTVVTYADGRRIRGDGESDLVPDGTLTGRDLLANPVLVDNVYGKYRIDLRQNPPVDTAGRVFAMVMRTPAGVLVDLDAPLPIQIDADHPHYFLYFEEVAANGPRVVAPTPDDSDSEQPDSEGEGGSKRSRDNADDNAGQPSAKRARNY